MSPLTFRPRPPVHGLDRARSFSVRANTSATFTAPKVSPGQTAVLVFQLRVTDNNGATATDEVTITVTR